MNVRSLLALLAAALVGCGGSSKTPPPPSLMLTQGGDFAVDGCSFKVHTPPNTTAPVVDDGSVGAQPAPHDVHLGLVGDPRTSIAVTWSTDVATRGTEIEYGPDTSYGQKAHGFWFAYPSSTLSPDVIDTGIHQAHVCGLKAGTTYHYRVGTGSQKSPDATFTTAPEAGGHVKVLMVGDSRLNPMEWQTLIHTAASREAPQVAVYTGDAVFDGSDQGQWEQWLAAGKGVIESLPMLMINGNHEDNAYQLYAQFPMPGNQQWFSFDYGDAHFAVVNDGPVDTGTIAGVQAAFLDQDLGATQRVWKIASHHRPEYTASTIHDSATELQQAWSPKFDSHAVDLVVTGHVHSYERSKPLKAGQVVADGAGPVYVADGGGGAMPYGVQAQPFTAFAKTIYSYVILDITPNQIVLTAKDDTGAMVDSYTLHK